MADDAEIMRMLGALTASMDTMRASHERMDGEFITFRADVRDEHRAIREKLGALSEKVTFTKACWTILKWLVVTAIAAAGVAVAYRNGGN
jgi:hypothetical protein